MESNYITIITSSAGYYPDCPHSSVVVVVTSVVLGEWATKAMVHQTAV